MAAAPRWGRGSDMVLAAHRTALRGRLVATTVETVRFTRPERIDFRLTRGPVPYVLSRFALLGHAGGFSVRVHRPTWNGSFGARRTLGRLGRGAVAAHSAGNVCGGQSRSRASHGQPLNGTRKAETAS
jgi:hypothetical protein